MKTIFSIFGILLLSFSAHAASIQYTFTFETTSISARTSYSLTVPALLNGSNSFTADKAQLISAPGSGAVFLSPYPAIMVDSSGSVTAAFDRSLPSTIWQFKGITEPLTSLGTFAIGSDSTVFNSANGGTIVPVAGLVQIAPIVGIATPEPGPAFLLPGGLLFILMSCWVRFCKSPSRRYF